MLKIKVEISLHLQDLESTPNLGVKTTIILNLGVTTNDSIVKKL